MKCLCAVVLSCGSLPLLGWTLSVGWSLLTTQSFFSWSPVAYAPLFVVTLPLEDLYKTLLKLNGGETHLLVLLYAFLASAIYMLITALVLSPMFVAKWSKKA